MLTCSLLLTYLLTLPLSANITIQFISMPPKTAKRKRVDEVEENEEDDDSNKSNDDDSSKSSNDGSSNDNNEDSDDNDDDDDDDDNDKDQEDDDEPKGKKKAVTKKATPKAQKAAAKKATSKSKSKVDKKKKSKKKENESKKSSSTSSSVQNGEGKERKPKQLRKYERLEEARKAYKWWEAPDLPDGINWRTLEHPAIYFPPEYVPHHIPMLYDNKPVKLNSEQEEIVSFYAAMPLDGPQLGNPKTRPVFQKNFFEDFTASLGTGHVVKKFEKCNFDDIRRHLDFQKSLKKTASDEEKQQKKLEKENLLLKYGYALIDGRIEKMVVVPTECRNTSTNLPTVLSF